MNLYILRAKPHNINREKQFLDGDISIGWHCGQNLLNKSRKELEDILEHNYPNISAINISQVEQFIKIPKGSIVLTPSISKKGFLHVFKTITLYTYRKENDIDGIGNPHMIRVEFLKTIEKTSLDKAIQKSLSGARKTVSNISQHSEKMDVFLKSKNSTPTISSNEGKKKALEVLEKLLDSDDEEIRLRASITLLDKLE